MLSKDPLTWLQDSPQMQALLSAYRADDGEGEPSDDLYTAAVADARELLPELAFLTDWQLYELVDDYCNDGCLGSWRCYEAERPGIGLYALSLIVIGDTSAYLNRGNYKRPGKHLTEQLALTGSVDDALLATRSCLAKLLR